MDGILRYSLCMIKWLRRLILISITLLCLGWLFVFAFVAPSVDARMNPVTPHEAYQVSNSTQSFHDSLLIADLHGDVLLWKRNPEKRQTRGQIDLPRLRDGGVDIQVFSAVTKTPRGLNFDGNSADAPDNQTLLAMGQLWPARTWQSIFQRAVFQAERLQTIEQNPTNKLVIARSKEDLDQPSGTIIAILATEGSHPLEGNLEKIDRLYNEGYRMMGLQHFFDNELGGSLHGEAKGGLTPFGRDAVQKMREMNIIVDVAHSSEKVVRDVLAMSSDPVIISHGGVRSDCAATKKRNLPDEQLRQIAKNGGLLGIGYFHGAICDISPTGIADAIVKAINLMGPDAVALGSDFDGAVKTALDTSELAAITQALKNRGVKEATIRKVMGENVQRFLRENMPD